MGVKMNFNNFKFRVTLDKIPPTVYRDYTLERTSRTDDQPYQVRRDDDNLIVSRLFKISGNRYQFSALANNPGAQKYVIIFHSTEWNDVTIKWDMAEYRHEKYFEVIAGQ